MKYISRNMYFIYIYICLDLHIHIGKTYIIYTGIYDYICKYIYITTKGVAVHYRSIVHWGLQNITSVHTSVR